MAVDGDGGQTLEHYAVVEGVQRFAFGGEEVDRAVRAGEDPLAWSFAGDFAGDDWFDGLRLQAHGHRIVPEFLAAQVKAQGSGFAHFHGGTGQAAPEQAAIAREIGGGNAADNTIGHGYFRFALALGIEFDKLAGVVYTEQ